MIFKTKNLQEVCSKILPAVETSEMSSISDVLQLKARNGILTLAVTNREYYVEVSLDTVEDVDFNLLTDKSSIEVIKLLYELKSIIIKAVEKNEPSILARYLIDLAQSFSNFYNANRTLPYISVNACAACPAGSATGGGHDAADAASRPCLPQGLDRSAG